MMNCIVIDDEPLARECIINYIGQVDFMKCAGTGISAMDIPELLTSSQVDILFLDVQMPMMNGLDYLKSNPRPPMTVLTTAFPNYAIEGFDLNVLDYLLKPISFNRFFTAATKAKQQMELLQKKPLTALKEEERTCFFVKCDGKYEKIYHDEILFVAAMQNYVAFYTDKRRYMSLLPLKHVVKRLDSRAFLQVHKSYIVAVDKIEGIAQHEIQIRKHKIPISRNYKKEVLPKILGKNLWSGKS